MSKYPRILCVFFVVGIASLGGTVVGFNITEDFGNLTHHSSNDQGNAPGTDDSPVGWQEADNNFPDMPFVPPFPGTGDMMHINTTDDASADVIDSFLMNQNVSFIIDESKMTKMASRCCPTQTHSQMLQLIVTTLLILSKI
jgi:hypothetical protein